ncbi:ABC transporter ATP-binding protein [Frankia coriariae]|uniref:ABC transporter ATP-binding protein n=1 Tax=Protofrankia coriariae TaxID=1562887 RepID=UPI000A32834A
MNAGPAVTERADALQLCSVTAGYGRSTVLREVTLTVPAGSVVALLGPNGAGKTTLLRAAAGLLRPSAGTVTVTGRDVTRSSPHQRARAGLCLVPEGRGIFPSLTVQENLQLQLPSWRGHGGRGRGGGIRGSGGRGRDSGHGDDSGRDDSGRGNSGVDAALDAFPVLRDRLRQVAGTLSGGQQQMLALARCYLSDPAVVLLDEVSMGLAPRVIDQIFESLRGLAASGVSLLLVEQYVSRALEMADVVCLLGRGRVGFTGAPSELDEDELVRGYLSAGYGPGHGPGRAAGYGPGRRRGIGARSRPDRHRTVMLFSRWSAGMTTGTPEGEG